MSKQHKKHTLQVPAPPLPPPPSPQHAAQVSFFEKTPLAEITLAAAALVVWAACISNGFVFFDDDKAIFYNSALKNPSLGKFFSGQNLGMYAPISWIAYWVGQLISGQEAWGYHLLGVLLHALNTVLAFRLLRGLTGRSAAAFFAALLFAVHPVQAEAVCWAAALSTVLFSTFYLASALAWLSWRRGGSVAWLALSLLFFTLACLSKSAAVTLPLVLLAMEWYVRRNIVPAAEVSRNGIPAAAPVGRNDIVTNSTPSRNTIPAYMYLPYFALSLWFGLNTFATRTAEGHDIEQTSAAFSALDRFWMVSQTLLFYPFKLLLPFGFSISYPFVKNGGGSWPIEYYVAPVALAALGFFVWKKWRDRPELLLGLALYLLPLTVMLPFRTVGSFELRSDRYVYLSCLGLFFVAGIFWEKMQPTLRTATLAGVGAALGILAFLQTSVWRDGVAMFQNCVEKTPESALCQCNLAYNKLISLDFQAAADHYSAALNSDATYIEAHNGRGQAYLNLRQIPQAYEDFDRAIKGGLSSPKLYLNRGKCHVMLSRPAEAMPDLQKSIELEPKEPEVWYLKGVANEKLNQLDAAIADYARAIELRPNYVEALTNRGVLLLNARRLEEAVAAFDAGIAVAPNMAMLHSNRANANFQLGRYADAVSDASKALSLNAKYLPAYQIRGNAYIRLGDSAKGQADLQQAAVLQKK